MLDLIQFYEISVLPVPRTFSRAKPKPDNKTKYKGSNEKIWVRLSLPKNLFSEMNFRSKLFKCKNCVIGTIQVY